MAHTAAIASGRRKRRSSEPIRLHPCSGGRLRRGMRPARAAGRRRLRNAHRHCSPQHPSARAGGGALCRRRWSWLLRSMAPMEYCHICTGTGLAPAPSAPGLGSPLPHPHRDWAHPITSAPGLRLPAVLGPRIAWLLSTLPRFATSAYVSARPPIDRRWCVESAFCVVPLLRLSVPLLRLSVPLLRLSVPLLRLSVPFLRLSVPLLVSGMRDGLGGAPPIGVGRGQSRWLDATKHRGRAVYCRCEYHRVPPAAVSTTEYRLTL
jgi:hypothetical protein